MNQKQILEMAKESGIFEITKDGYEVFYPDNLEDFAKLVAKAKAEEIATELLKGPVNDTAASIAIWIRSQE